MKHSCLSSFRRFLGASAIRYLCSLMLMLGITLGIYHPPADAIAVYQLPALSAGENTWIVDEANIISRINENKISNRLSQLAESTGNEVRLVTIRHFDYGETIDTFTAKLFDQWYPTPEAQAHQTLMVLDEVTKTVGIKVGPEAADILPADIADSVAQETVLYPLLEDDKYNQAFLDGADRLVAILSGEVDPGPPAFDDSFDSEGTFATAEETEENRSNNLVIVVILLVLATVIPMATYFWYAGFGS
jgi:uncharacterized protein